MGRSPKLKKLVISGDPYSRGVQYGEKARALIEKGLKNYRLAFLQSSGVIWEKAVRFSKTFVKRIKAYDEAMADEIKGVAKGSGRLLEEILILNLRTEILHGLKQSEDGCTALCCLPEITREKRTLLAQNWDYKPWIAETMLLLQIDRRNGPDILTIVEAGQMARMGMNSAGHGLCNNYIESEEDGSNMEKGIPTTFIRRKALGQEKYYDVLGAIIHTPRSFSAHYLVATAEGDGDAVDIETTPDQAYFLFPENGWVTHANHFMGKGPGYVGALWTGVENSLYRDRRAGRLLGKEAGKIGIHNIQNVLRDHFGYPRSICRHLDEEEAEKYRWRTNASVIMDLSSKVLWLAAGPPCQCEYHRYTFDREK